MNNKLLPLTLTGLVVGVGLLLTTIALALASPPAQVTPSETTQASAAWSSGWFTVTPGTVSTLSHNLGGDPRDYVVDMWYVDTDAFGLGINARAFGGMESYGNYSGATWQNLSSNKIEVYRYEDDGHADLIRVDVFQPDEGADYCSPWTPIAQGQVLTFAHNLGGDVDDLVAALEYSGTVGITRRAYGGLEISNTFQGAYWLNLTTSTVQVFRYADDTFAEQVQICVNQPDPPDFDTGWITDVPTGGIRPVPHNLAWNPARLRMRLDYRDTDDGLGINHYAAGGMSVGDDTALGVDWHNLSSNAVTVERGPQDLAADQIRVRIWKMGPKVYLPIVARAYAPPTELAHDDGSADSNQSQITLDSGFAVQFTAPSDGMQLITARYYLNTAADDHPIQVHVWDATHSALITHTATPPAGEGWFDVDLTGLNVTVSGDFYVGFWYAEQHSDPSIGVDANNSGHSYEVDGGYWEDVPNSEYMIRAVLVP